MRKTAPCLSFKGKAFYCHFARISKKWERALELLKMKWYTEIVLNYKDRKGRECGLHQTGRARMTTNQKERPGVMLYFDVLRPMINRLDAAQCGELLRSIVDYAQYGVVPELDPMTGMAFDMLVPKIDHDVERYEESREQRQYAAYVREKKRSGEQALSIADWRLARPRTEERENIVPSRPDNGPLPSASASTSASTSVSTSTSATASASPSVSVSPSASADAAGEGSKGEGEAQELYAQWLRALDAKDNTRALELDGRLFALGYKPDLHTRKLKKRKP